MFLWHFFVGIWGFFPLVSVEMLLSNSSPFLEVSNIQPAKDLGMVQEVFREQDGVMDSAFP